MARTISLVNQKGGTGKTTICINLGIGLAHLNKKVLIIDMDFQCSATTGLGLDRNKIKLSAFDLIEKKEVYPEDTIKNTYLENLKIIPASFELKLISLLSETEPQKNMILKEKIEKTKLDFDFILIDNPPSISAIVYNSLFASDSVYIPIDMSYFGLEGLDQVDEAINLINRLRNEHSNTAQAEQSTKTTKPVTIGGVIINRWDSITKISREIYEIMKKKYSNRLFNTKIRNNTTIKEAIGEGISIIDYAPSSHGAKDFINLTEEVIKRESER